MHAGPNVPEEADQEAEPEKAHCRVKARHQEGQLNDGLVVLSLQQHALMAARLKELALGLPE